MCWDRAAMDSQVGTHLSRPRAPPGCLRLPAHLRLGQEGQAVAVTTTLGRDGSPALARRRWIRTGKGTCSARLHTLGVEPPFAAGHSQRSDQLWLVTPHGLDSATVSTGRGSAHRPCPIQDAGFAPSPVSTGAGRRSPLNHWWMPRPVGPTLRVVDAPFTPVDSGTEEVVDVDPGAPRSAAGRRGRSR